MKLKNIILILLVIFLLNIKTQETSAFFTFRHPRPTRIPKPTIILPTWTARWKHRVTTTPTATPTPTVTPTPTQSVIFEDDFNGLTLNTDLWDIFPNNGAYYLADGFLNIPGGNIPGMPFFRSKSNPFPSEGPFSVEFGIQYLSFYPAGVGLTLSFTQQLNSTPIDFNNMPISIWGDNGIGGFKIVYFGNINYMGGLNTNYHIVKINYYSEKYLIYIDDDLKYTTPSTNRVGGLWFGHPYYSDLPGWTGFKMDYIRIKN